MSIKIQRGGIKLGDTVFAIYRWNFGRTVKHRVRLLRGTLDIGHDDGISLYFLGDNRISYKSLKSITPGDKT